MLKRTVDIVSAIVGLVLISPLMFFFCIAVWLQDFGSPFYIADRVGLGGTNFGMIKLRSMVINADSSGVTSTSDADRRVTTVGRLIRKLKLDEFTQLLNVLKGDMSLVGPRPNVVKWGVELYTNKEMRLLSVRPGITDFASIVFADEGSILSASEDPDLTYNQIIRPWKSRLSLIYIDHQSLLLDVKLVLSTMLSIVSRSLALKLVVRELRILRAPESVVQVASRTIVLTPHPPPGSRQITSLRE